MALVNKILNFVILALAVLACVVSINMANKRVVLKERGDKLQKVVSQTAKSLDGEEGSTALGTTYGEELADSELAWEKWAESPDARDAYEKKINTLPEAAKTVVDVKAGIAKAAVSIAKTLDTPAAAEENFETSLNYATGWEKGMSAIDEHAGKVTAQRDGLVAGIVATSKAINKPVSEEALTDIEGKSYEKSLEILADNAQNLKTRADDLSTSYAESVAKLKKALGDKFKLKTDEDLLKSESAQDYKEASADFQTKDVATISKAIAKYLKSEQVIAKLQADNVEQAEEVRALEKSLIVIKKQNEELLIIGQAKDNKIAKLEKELNKTVPKDLTASVLNFDDKFNFVIIDKGRKDQLVESAELIIHRDFNYVCKVVVSKLYEDKAVCEVIDTQIKKGNPATGDVVIVHP